MNKDIYLTNNLSNKKEKFNPLNKEKIGMYVCGPTVYDNPHIGNARPLVIFDILFKVLKSKYGNDSVNREKYEKIRKMNLHKMEPIPVCKIPN